MNSAFREAGSRGSIHFGITASRQGAGQSDITIKKDLDGNDEALSHKELKAVKSACSLLDSLSKDGSELGEREKQLAFHFGKALAGMDDDDEDTDDEDRDEDEDEKVLFSSTIFSKR